jgi:hypothetical protein
MAFFTSFCNSSFYIYEYQFTVESRQPIHILGVPIILTSNQTMEPQSTEENKPAQRTPNIGMGGTYDGDIPAMEPAESGNSAHYPSDAASDTGRPSAPEKGEAVQDGEGAGTSYDYQADPKIAGRQERDPDMDTGNHARDVQRDMIAPSENSQPEGREPRRPDHMSEDSDESDAIPTDQDETAGIP